MNPEDDLCNELNLIKARLAEIKRLLTKQLIPDPTPKYGYLADNVIFSQRETKQKENTK